MCSRSPLAFGLVARDLHHYRIMALSYRFLWKLSCPPRVALVIFVANSDQRCHHSYCTKFVHTANMDTQHEPLPTNLVMDSGPRPVDRICRGILLFRRIISHRHIFATDPDPLVDNPWFFVLQFGRFYPRHHSLCFLVSWADNFQRDKVYSLDNNDICRHLRSVDEYLLSYLCGYCKSAKLALFDRSEHDIPKLAVMPNNLREVNVFCQSLYVNSYLAMLNSRKSTMDRIKSSNGPVSMIEFGEFESRHLTIPDPRNRLSSNRRVAEVNTDVVQGGDHDEEGYTDTNPSKSHLR